VTDPSTLVDTHCHVAHISDDPQRILADARQAGVDTVIDIGMGTEESAVAARRAAELAPGLYATVGVHPNDLTEYEADPQRTMTALRELAEQPGVVGVGETGLDHYRDRSGHDLQERAFRAQIELARDVDRTLVIHCRDAHDRLLEVLQDAGPPERVVMHCFSGDVQFARVCADLGYYCSFAGNLTYRRSNELRAAAQSMPAELLLVETDAPFLAPLPHRGKPNHPALLPNTVAALAEARSMPLRPLTKLLRANAERAFRIG
jgi:TatD DNase family protein